MSEHIEIKLVINQVDHPRLYSALAAQENPRRRAALLRRLAEEGCRPEAREQVHSPALQVPQVYQAPVTQKRRDTHISNEEVISQPTVIPETTPRKATSAPKPTLQSESRAPDLSQIPDAGKEDAETGDDLDYSHLDSDAVNQLFAAFG